MVFVYTGRSDPERCAASVHDGGYSVRDHQCTRKAVVEHDGLRWCRQHNPAAVEAKRAAASAAFDLRWNYGHWSQRMNQHYTDIGAAVLLYYRLGDGDGGTALPNLPDDLQEMLSDASAHLDSEPPRPA